ncbi:MAG: mycothiol synthase [Actinobacteria bacterium]|nr:mycothiol synthase [Actinomycetota bacterium]
MVTQVRRELSDEERQAIRGLATELERRDGAPPLSDQALADLVGDAGVHVLVRTDGHLRGYGQLAHGSAEVLAGPEELNAVLDALEAQADDFEIWAHGSTSRIAAAVAARGYEQVRLLHRLRRPLGDIAEAAWPVGVHGRTFELGRDEPAWLALNAAAFAHHPEQGRWTRADLEAREKEDWFDPDGFLIAERSGEMIGFHWTKRHPDAVGEVYVLGVAPGAQGTGLGKALLMKGLRHLAASGSSEVILYVDDDNATALRLYERAGFERAATDIQFRRPGRARSG